MLFLDYEHREDGDFRVEVSVEEGSIRIGIMQESTGFKWSPNLPIMEYPVNNLSDLSSHVLTYNTVELTACLRCRYVIAIQAVSESRLSAVVKSPSVYSIFPSQRMLKVEGRA